VTPADRIEEAIAGAKRERRPAIAAYLTAGYPSQGRFAEALEQVESAAELVEIGVPFSDPMADGVTIQRSSRRALEAGTTLEAILAQLAGHGTTRPPRLLMSYLNPLLAFGFEALATAALRGGVCGFIVPDLPLEESGPLRDALDPHGIALVQLVSPVTPPDRALRLCRASRGFVYAVTMTGTTGGSASAPSDVLGYLDRVRAASPLPVLAGFGIRRPDQVRALSAHVDGVVVGSALIEALDRGEDLREFLGALRGPTT
jgi:tryptophan synthase alpha chain